jgi:hypothetical protein
MSRALEVCHVKDRVDADEGVGRTEDDASEPRVLETFQNERIDPGRLRSAELKARHHGFTALAHEVMLKIHRPFRGPDERGDGVVGHRQDGVPDAQGCGQ